MINKEAFIKAVTAIIERQKLCGKLSSDLETLGINLTSDPLEDMLVETLDAALDLGTTPGFGLVSWWLYDCSRTRAIGEPARFRWDAKNYLISSPEELYDLAVICKWIQP